ncbi:protein SCO1 homolog 1, mitochondrial-like [Olea europaea var. sylvestris]|uniref:protein SCO1 homolog 1, mitochondrial-like n=1 Tax=Olea europaea var. sylvestris TaxID=158386 RepID=UPI000C1D4A1D|nr:protein SCO1 homolog 1, mitochondrial-like [Olea europaea var. sylvestris]
MASSISRSLRLRSFYGFLTSQWRFSKPSFHSLPENSCTFPSNFFRDDRYGKYPAFAALNFKFLCTTATGNTINPSNSDAPGAGKSTSGSSDGNSGNSNDGKSSGGSQGKPVRGGPVSWMSFFLLLCTGAGLVYYYDREKERHIEGINSASNAVRQGPSVGKAAIGGPFNLIDHNGKAVTDKNFVGKWNLIYFGFTHCPDICPDELQKLATAIDKIKEKSGMEVVPVFISVDPERDTVEQVREYVKEFHPKLIGLTGSSEEIKRAARAYRVYYMKTEEEGSDYLVDHSIVMYLMDPNMQFVKFFGKNVDTDSLADGVVQEIKQHKVVKA